MSIGYACLTVGVPDTDFKSCILKNANQAKLRELIAHNLDSLENIIDYNLKHHIQLFRISSDLIPFGSSPVNELAWQEEFSPQLHRIGLKIKNGAMRVSMHPGQYTVLNSPDADVVTRAIADLVYHVQVLESLGVDETHKIVLHIGGVYKNKMVSARRFISHFTQLDKKVQQRLVIENDDRLYNIADVLEISQVIKAPVIFDNLHHMINKTDTDVPEDQWIAQCGTTWSGMDGKQKIHYSQQDPWKKPGSHSNTIIVNEFKQFYDQSNVHCLDIMLEVKDKNLSAIKCINCISEEKNITRLESEWSKYKYTVLERSPEDYNAIRLLLKDKNAYPAKRFYELLEGAQQLTLNSGTALNAAQHVWGYFKDVALTKEKDKFFELMEKYQSSEISLAQLKNHLHKLAVKYQRDYLLNSYYFVF